MKSIDPLHKGFYCTDPWLGFNQPQMLAQEECHVLETMIHLTFVPLKGSKSVPGRMRATSRYRSYIWGQSGNIGWMLYPSSGESPGFCLKHTNIVHDQGRRIRRTPRCHTIAYGLSRDIFNPGGVLTRRFLPGTSGSPLTIIALVGQHQGGQASLGGPFAHQLSTDEASHLANLY